METPCKLNYTMKKNHHFNMVRFAASISQQTSKAHIIKKQHQQNKTITKTLKYFKTWLKLFPTTHWDTSNLTIPMTKIIISRLGYTVKIKNGVFHYTLIGCSETPQSIRVLCYTLNCLVALQSVAWHPYKLSDSTAPMWDISLHPCRHCHLKIQS